jgi:hypothetical protein
MEIRWFFKRIALFWKLVRLLPYARKFELDYQRMKQNEHNAAFVVGESGISSKREEYVYWLGYTDGVNFLLNHPVKNQ